MLAKRTEKPSREEVSVPILCKFWSEDGVWNGSAEHLPVAVFGNTFEEAKNNLRLAIVAHFEALHEAGKAEEVFEELQKVARDFFSVNDFVVGSPMLSMLVAMKNQEILAFA